MKYAAIQYSLWLNNIYVAGLIFSMGFCLGVAVGGLVTKTIQDWKEAKLALWGKK